MCMQALADRLKAASAAVTGLMEADEGRLGGVSSTACEELLLMVARILCGQCDTYFKEVCLVRLRLDVCCDVDKVEWSSCAVRSHNF